jgi:tripartite-type tricarboxylate transporter receptor subunit TctC
VPEFPTITILAADSIGSTPDELASYNRSEIVKWAKVIKAAGIKPD